METKTGLAASSPTGGTSVGGPHSSPLERGRGFIDYIEYRDGRLMIGGWMFLRGRSFDDYVLKVNGVINSGARLVERPDVRDAFSDIPSSLRSGFWVEAQMSESRVRDWLDLDVIGVANGQEIAIISTAFRAGYADGLSSPPARLMHRVAHTEAAANYWCSALTSFSEYRKTMRQHVADASIGRLLDWGCGCGRMTSLFLKHSGIAEIHGCDIDAEAVAWCRTNLSKGRFDTIPLLPPTVYPGDHFGAIISYSVFTHLVRDVQKSWLKEMRRILRPGGYFFASCHGDFATSFSHQNVRDEVQRDGISDGMLDAHLEGVAPKDYYRATFQSQAYTVSEFGKIFRVVDYLPRAVASFQDLIVMQKVD